MTGKHFAATLVNLMLALTAGAQPGADLLQKGLYAQETQGNLDSAVQIYRQVTDTAGVSKQFAAQAQYQLVLCMLQKGDPSAASHELDLLTRNFPDQQDYIGKARKLIPGGSTTLAPPWVDGEASQLNIKRNGEFTGEYLYYSATPWRDTVSAYDRDLSRYPQSAPKMQGLYLRWDLVTKASTRFVEWFVDRESMNRLDAPRLGSNDLLGDASVAPLAGPAIDAEPVIFRIRLLPLSVGYKTTLSTMPFALGHGVSRPVEMAVTGVETVQTAAGQFRCYKVVFASLGQTFWFGVEGGRPLVKFQAANVEAELVKVWSPNTFSDALDFLRKAGWTVGDIITQPGKAGVASAYSKVDGPYGKLTVQVAFDRLSVARERAAEPGIVCSDEARQHGAEWGVRPQSLQTRTFGGYEAFSCLVESHNSGVEFFTWVRNGSLTVMFSPQGNVAVFRWLFEPILDTIKLP